MEIATAVKSCVVRTSESGIDEYLARGDVWVQNSADAEPLFEEYAKTKVRVLRFKDPKHQYDYRNL